METLKNPNSQGPEDLTNPSEPKVVYPAKQSFEFEGMDINSPSQQKGPPSVYPSSVMPTPAPMQVVPEGGMMGSIMNSIIPSASASDEVVSRLDEIAKGTGIKKDIEGPEIDFVIRSTDGPATILTTPYPVIVTGKQLRPKQKRKV